MVLVSEITVHSIPFRGVSFCGMPGHVAREVMLPRIDEYFTSMKINENQ